LMSGHRRPPRVSINKPVCARGLRRSISTSISAVGPRPGRQFICPSCAVD
jgi:hypothetical protein